LNVTGLSPSTQVVALSITNTSAQRGDVTRLYLATALPASVSINANVALAAPGLPALPRAYRIIELQPSEDDGDRISVQAIEIDTGKWAASDTVDPYAGVIYDPLPTPPEPPSDLEVKILTRVAP
jgi:hypothetical protein